MKKNTKITSFVLVMLLILQVILPVATNVELSTSNATTTQLNGYYIDNFNNDNVTLSGNAYISNGDIYLTSNQKSQVGAAFFNEKINETDGFSTYFCLSTKRNSTPADGFTIIVTEGSNIMDYSGRAGGAMGYAQIDHSIGIEIDMYKNTENRRTKYSSYVFMGRKNI